jgi:pilus assembly protein CpaC
MVCSMFEAVRGGMSRVALVLLMVVGLAGSAAVPASALAGRSGEPLSVAAGRSLVIEMPNDVSTVSIADAKVADAAVGSARTVVVNGKAPGKTSLVVWEDSGHFTLYDVTVTDQSSKPQVMLECKISELNLQKMKEMGFDWVAMLRDAEKLNGTLTGGLFVTKVETPNDPPILGPNADGFAAWKRADGNASFLSTFRLMEENGAVKTLASPNLVATSGDSAAFLAGGEFPVPIARSASETGTTVTIEWKEYGIKLKAVPTVLDKGRIRLYVAPEVSAPDYSHTVLLNGYVIPGVTTRRVGTTVEMNSGDVLVIGGVKHSERSQTIRRVPVLGSIPLINYFFRYKKTELIERDLMVAVTPRLLGDLAKSYPTMPTDDKWKKLQKDNDSDQGMAPTPQQTPQEAPAGTGTTAPQAASENAPAIGVAPAGPTTPATQNATTVAPGAAR